MYICIHACMYGCMNYFALLSFCTIQVSKMCPIRENSWLCKYSWYNTSFLVIAINNSRYQLLTCLWCSAGKFFHAISSWYTQQAYVGDAIPFASKAKLLLGHWISESWHDWTTRVLRFSSRPGTDSGLPTHLLEWDRPLTLSFISLSFNGLIHKMRVITSST